MSAEKEDDRQPGSNLYMMLSSINSPRGITAPAGVAGSARRSANSWQNSMSRLCGCPMKAAESPCCSAASGEDAAGSWTPGLRIGLSSGRVDKLASEGMESHNGGDASSATGSPGELSAGVVLGLPGVVKRLPGVVLSEGGDRAPNSEWFLRLPLIGLSGGAKAAGAAAHEVERRGRWWPESTAWQATRPPMDFARRGAGAPKEGLPGSKCSPVDVGCVSISAKRLFAS